MTLHNAPNHHPHDSLIYSFAKGSQDQALNLMLATHFHNCAHCSNLLNAAEHLYGGYISDLPQQASDIPSDHDFDQLWSKIETNNAHQHNKTASKTTSSDKKLTPLERYLNRNQHNLKINNNIPNISETILPLSNNDIKVSVLNIAAGTHIPQHTHQGLEMTQVISGGFFDEKSQYHAGDLSIKDQADNHTPVIFDDAPCVCLVVRYGSLKFTGSMRFVYNAMFKLLD